MPDKPERLWSIEWSGIITRDIGWDEVLAATADEAKTIYLREHGQYRRVRSVCPVKLQPPR